MKERLISFKLAKLAKEKGFDWNTLYYHATCNGIYDDNDRDKGYSGSGIPANNWNKDIENHIEQVELYSAPNQSLLAKWLRDVHNLSVEVCVGENKWEYSIYTIKGFEHMISSGIIFTVYEEALEAGLNNALLLI